MAEENNKKRGVKGALKSIVGTFVEIQPDENDVQAEPATTTKTITIPIAKMPTPTEGAEGTEQTATIDEGLFETLAGVIEESNIPGPDYVELIQAADSMGEAGMDDTTKRYQTAFKVIKSMNPTFTKEIVLNSIDEYIRILDKERENAMGELQTMWTRDVATPEAELKQNEAEIAQLQKRLAELTAIAGQKRQSIERAKVDNQAKRANFEFTFKVFKERFVTDKEKLTNILQ